MSSTETITTSTFDGLAFPVAKVRYTGNGYSAVPGDLNADFYTFTFVPKHFFAGR